jgi:hypothetical protein
MKIAWYRTLASDWDFRSLLLLHSPLSAQSSSVFRQLGLTAVAQYGVTLCFYRLTYFVLAGMIVLHNK